jgi:hypothetical protein
VCVCARCGAQNVTHAARIHQAPLFIPAWRIGLCLSQTHKRSRDIRVPNDSGQGVNFLWLWQHTSKRKQSWPLVLTCSGMHGPPSSHVHFDDSLTAPSGTLPSDVRDAPACDVRLIHARVSKDKSVDTSAPRSHTTSRTVPKRSSPHSPHAQWTRALQWPTPH